MSPVTAGNSFWMASVPPTSYPSLAGDISADVCIVGGGITGLLCAHELAEAGRTVVVVESRRLASRVTGFTTAKVTSQHGLRYRRLTDERGADVARAYGRANQDALARIRSLVTHLRLDADLETRNAFVYGTSPDSLELLKSEAEAAHDAGLPASFVTDVPLPFNTVGAVRFADQAQVHPRRLMVSLAGALTERGVRIFEASKATKIDNDGRWTVTCTDGTVTADAVVVAALTPAVGVGNDLWEHLYCHQGFAVAMPLLGDGPGGVFISCDRPMRSFRTIKRREGRLLQVGGAAFVENPNDGDEPYDDLVAWAHEHFDVGETEFRWTTQDYSTADGVPLIGALDDGLYIATGLGGWGMTTAGVAAAIVRDLMSGTTTDADRDQAFDPKRELPKVDDALISAHTSSGTDQAAVDVVRGLAPGQAAVVRHHGEQLAVYRGPEGDLDVVSAVCTHAGCIVLWDHEATDWTCPCHGSRFSPDGSVVAGPARTPLAPHTGDLAD